MKTTLSLLLPAIVLCFAGSAAGQTGTLDQSELHDNVSWNMGYFNDFQQEIQVGIPGVLEGFKIRMATQNVAVGQPVAVFVGPGPHAPSATPAWTGVAYATQTITWEWVFVDCSAAGLQFSVNDIFTIRIGDTTTFATGVSLTGNAGWPNPFYWPQFYEDQLPQGTTRLTFETYVVPPSLTLSVSGSCGGMMTLDVANGNGTYVVVYGDAGTSTVRGLDFLIANPTIAMTIGSSVSTIVPARACGKTVQVVDTFNFEVSNAVVL